MSAERVQQIIGFVITLLMIVVGALAGGGHNSGSSASISPGESDTGTSSDWAAATVVTQQELFAATNRYREQAGLAPLQPLAELNTLAQDWSAYLADTGEFQHRPDYSDYYPAGAMGSAENIAMSLPDASADDIIRQWHNSPGHRANMLNPHFTHLGVGVAKNSAGNYLATQNFARY